MPDITMCFNKNCPLRKKCYRFMAKPDTYQAYFVDVKPKNGKCEHFLPYGGIQSESLIHLDPMVGSSYFEYGIRHC